VLFLEWSFDRARDLVKAILLAGQQNRHVCAPTPVRSFCLRQGGWDVYARTHWLDHFLHADAR